MQRPVGVLVALVLRHPLDVQAVRIAQRLQRLVGDEQPAPRLQHAVGLAEGAPQAAQVVVVQHLAAVDVVDAARGQRDRA